MRRRSVVAARVPLAVATVSLFIATALIWTPPAAAQSDSLALVYFERGVLQGGHPSAAVLWAMAPDGSSKRELARFGLAAFPLALHGSMTAVYEHNDVTFIDVASGRVRTVDAGGWPYAGQFATGGPDAGSLFYSTQKLCTQNEHTFIAKIDPETGIRTEIAAVDDTVVELSWHDPKTGDVLAIPRTCSPKTWELRRLDGASGAQQSAMPITGCGWFRIAPDGRQALASLSVCRDGQLPEVNVYGLPDGGVRELRFGEDRPNDHPFLYSPDGSRAAFGLSLSPETRGRMTKSGGIWLMDTATLETSKLWQDARGMEAWPIDWSPGGSKLLVASMEAENYCAFSVVDVASGEATLVNGIRRCRIDGEMVGFASVPD